MPVEKLWLLQTMLPMSFCMQQHMRHNQYMMQHRMLCLLLLLKQELHLLLLLVLYQ